MTRQLGSITRILATLVLLTLALAACSAAPPTDNDIVGTWEYSRTYSTFRDTSGGRIEFKPDGTFTLQQIPIKILFGTETAADNATTTESGTWEVVAMRTGGGGPSVAFHTSDSSATPGYTAYLEVREEGPSRSLVGRIGDPDSDVWYSLKKKS